MVASSTLAVAVPLPAPPGWNIDVLTFADAQPESPAAGGGAIAFVVALPEDVKLTGALEIETASSAGGEVGSESRACQRRPRTVSRKFSVSGLLTAVTGKKPDHDSLPAVEYGWRKLIQSSTAPVDVRAMLRKSRTAVVGSPSW